MNNKLKVTLGIIFLPVFTALYFHDRLLLTVMPHLEQASIQKWFRDVQKMTSSALRIIVLYASIGLYNFILYLVEQFL